MDGICYNNTKTFRFTKGHLLMKHTASFFRLLAALLLTSVLAFPLSSFAVAGEETPGTTILPVNALNGTRWSDTLIVYRNKATTEQNQYGWNVVVDAEGKVTEKIPAGDERGKNLAIPAGGMVVSGCDDPGKAAYDAAEIGSNVYYDAYSSRVLISAGEIDPFYEYTLQANALNAVRYSGTLVIYDRAGTATETNGYGYEVCVGADGKILSVGDNNSTVPEGGYVLSAIERKDIDTLKTYFIPGASCERNGMSVTVRYEAPMLLTTVETELANIRLELEEATEQLRLVDYDGAKERLAQAEQTASDRAASGGLASFAERDEMLATLTPIRLMLTEQEPVQVRSSWYTPTQRTEEEVNVVVRRMAEVGLNQVRLGLPNGYHTYMPMPEELDDGNGGTIKFPFRTDARTNSVDLLALYVNACKAEGVELVVSIPVFYNSGARYQKEWMTTTNTPVEEPESFFSPANDEYLAYFSAYIRYLIQHYDIDGVEFDYIRYPYFNGNVDYGYDDATKAKFEEKTGLPASTVEEIGAQLKTHSKWNTWVQFKAGLITDYLRELREMIGELRPDLYVTAAVANDTTLTAYFQDSRTWMTEGLVDGIYPMAYSEGIMQQSTESFADFITEDTHLVMGCGAYQSYTTDEVLLQAKQASLYGADGIAYFEWSAYDAHGYADSLRETIYASDAISFTTDESRSIHLLVEQAKKRFALYGTEGTSADALFEQYENGSVTLSALTDSLKAEIPENKFLYRDLERALRIESMSREAYRGKVQLLPIGQTTSPAEDDNSDPSEGSDTPADPSAENTSGEESQQISEFSRNGGLIAAIIAFSLSLAAMGLCVVAAVIKMRRKHKKAASEANKH